MNPYLAGGLVAGVLTIVAVVFIREFSNNAKEAGAAEVKAEVAAEKVAEEIQVEAIIQKADGIIAEQRDPASGVERLQSGTA